MKKTLLNACLASLFMTIGLMPTPSWAAEKEPSKTINIAVMDPLAVQLACKCVEGFAQRDYLELADYLEKKLGCEVKCVFGESLGAAERNADGPIHLIVGKDSIVQHDAKKRDKKIRLLAALTDKEGKTSFNGLFVVPADSKAEKISDLKGYKIFFGPEEAIEKSEAAFAKLRENKVEVPKEITRSSNCTEAAFAALEYEGEPGAAAVISSYALTLLEGCNTIEKGTLRVIGKTDPVPFVRVFATDLLDEPTIKKLRKALFEVGKDPELLKIMESKQGFLPVVLRVKVPKKDSTKKPDDKDRSEVKKKAEPLTLHTGWPQWRGVNRDAHVKSLPKELPEKPKTVWEIELNTPGLAGIAADDRYVLIADRTEIDDGDRFLCLAADTGKKVWELTYSASGDMDYGCAPRASPLLIGDRAILLGALGDLHAVRLKDGEILWKKNFTIDFDGTRPTWGWCGSPILVDGKIIVQPGSDEASIIALDPATGKILWKTPGRQTAYSSLIVGTFGGVRQLIGYDETSLAGWDIKTGRRLWEMVPPEEGDFNVPTPVNFNGQLLLTSENNGTRIYRFAKSGVIEKEPLSQNFDLMPDSSTAVLSGGRVFGVYDAILCLDPKQKLETVASLEAEGCGAYASLIASDDRVLVVTMSGRLILVDTTEKEPKIVSEVAIFDDAGESYSHPALVGTRLYLRSGGSVRCVELK
ncbi:MAG: PhnD/SsuA/transferrin family substrate-binding protein [Planctomycetia bacterium]